MKKTACVLTILLVLGSVAACHKSVPEKQEPTAARPAVTVPAALPTEPMPTEPSTEPAPTAASTAPPATLPPTEPAAALVNGMRPEFQEAMDSYEAFMDDYVRFMTEYSQSDNALLMLEKYGEFMVRYADFTEKFEAWEDQNLNDAELRYYIAVQSRVSQKLLAAAASIPG